MHEYSLNIINLCEQMVLTVTSNGGVSVREASAGSSHWTVLPSSPPLQADASDKAKSQPLNICFCLGEKKMPFPFSELSTQRLGLGLLFHLLIHSVLSSCPNSWASFLSTETQSLSML